MLGCLPTSRRPIAKPRLRSEIVIFDCISLISPHLHCIRLRLGQVELCFRFRMAPLQDCTCAFMMFHFNECYRENGAECSRTGVGGKGRKKFHSSPAARLADFEADFTPQNTVRSQQPLAHVVT